MYDVHQNISIDRVDLHDLTYRITSSHDLDRLSGSMAAVGIINPPVLLESSENYRVVCGFGRIRAAARLSWTEIPARILSRHTASHTCIQMAIADNTANRELDVVEKARALKLLVADIPEKNRLAQACAMLGLSLNPELIEKLLLVNSMAPYLREGLVNGAIALPVALRLHQGDDQDSAQIIGQLLNVLNTSLNRQREIVDWFEAIQMREGTAILGIYKDLGIEPVLNDVELDRRQKIDFIRVALKKRRYPTIVAVEDRFKRLVDQLKLPAGCQLNPPPNFEGDVYTLKLDFRTIPDLIKLLEKMEELTNNRLLIEILAS